METKNICISIIIPVYNVEQYIVECLDSITNQTYQKNVECILVDDCSTDNSREVINEYISKYDGLIKFKVIYLKENQRQGIARNIGIEYSRGEYILFIDSDDIISGNCIEIMSDILKKYPNTDCIICSMSDNKGENIHTYQDYPKHVINRKWIIKKFLFRDKGIHLGPVNKLIKKKLIIDNNIKFPNKIIYEDVQFSFLLGIYTTSACFSHHITYLYRINREGSTINTSKKNEEFEITSKITLLNNLIELASPIYSNIQHRAICCRYLLYLRWANKNILYRKHKEFIQLQNKILNKMQFPLRILLKMFFTLPIQAQKNTLINKIMYNIIRYR